MSYVKAQQLLVTAAALYSEQQEFISKEDILKKLNEVKYLAAQKKIPRLTLRKELLHLEHKLHSVFELEQQLALSKKQESLKVQALKQQIAQLKNRFAAEQDADLQRKVEKLSHLLAECISLKKVKEDVELQEHTAREEQFAEQFAKPVASEKKEDRIAILQQRLISLREMLETKEEGIEPALAEQINEKISALEDKLKSLQKSASLPEEQAPQERTQVKHMLLFHLPPPQKKM